MNIIKNINILKNQVISSENAKKTLSNTYWLIGSKIYTLVVGVIATALITRYFGPEKYGFFNYALSITAIFTAFSTLGLETLSVKSLVEKRYTEGTVLGTSFVLRVIGGLFLSFAACITIRIIEPMNTMLQGLVLLLSLMMVVKSLEVIEYWIQTYQRAKISTIIRMIGASISALLKILLVVQKGSLIHFGLIFVFDTTLVGLSLLFAYFKIRTLKSPWCFNLKYAVDILSKSWYLIISGLLVTIYMRIDQVMLGSLLHNTKELGYYSLAVQLSSMWFFVPQAIIISFKPIIMKKKIENEKSYLQIVQILYTIITYLSLGFSVLISFLSKFIIFHIFGEAFSKSSSILIISIWAGVFAMLGSARGIWLICEGLQRYSVIYIGIGAGLNILMNYLLIPVLGGIGAAIASLASQVFVSIIVPYWFKDTRKSSQMIIKSFVLKGIAW